MEYLIKTYTNEGDTVLDFTMGSGTTGVACVNTNRDFIGIELDEGYFKIAKDRIEEEINTRFIRNKGIKSHNKAILERIHNGENPVLMYQDK